MIWGVFFSLVFIFIAWVILSAMFYESRGTVVALYFLFYALGFVFIFFGGDYPDDIVEVLFIVVLVNGCMIVAPLYMVFGIPTLIFLKSGRKGIGGMADIHSRRVTQDIPTSSIHTGAMGSHVEVKGALVAFKHQLPDNCDRSPEWWFTRDAFFIDDSSGSFALVDPAGAEIILRGKGLKLRVDVYVRGFAEAGRDYQTKAGLLGWGVYVLQMVSKRFHYINRVASKYMRQFTANKAGGPDPDALKREDALKHEEETLSPELESKTYPEMLSKTNMIFRKRAKDHLIISDRPEEGLKGYLRRRSFGRMLQSVFYLIATFFVFGAILSSCEKNCTIDGFSVNCSYNGSLFDK